jgi:hypothetical protein
LITVVSSRSPVITGSVMTLLDAASDTTGTFTVRGRFKRPLPAEAVAAIVPERLAVAETARC